MRWTIAGLMAGAMLTSLVGCGYPERRTQVSDCTVRLTLPESAAGKSEYEGEHLSIRLTEPSVRWKVQEPDMLCALIVENKRGIFARIDADRACLVDPKHGATNLLWKDAIIPPKCWTKIKGVSPGFINFYWQWSAWDSRQPQYTGGEQRVLLRVLWEDGVSETVDLTYEVKVQAGPEPH